jgi:hypothetical protein
MTAPDRFRRPFRSRPTRPSVGTPSSLAQVAARVAEDRRLGALAERFGLRSEAFGDEPAGGPLGLIALARTSRPGRLLRPRRAQPTGVARP